MKLLNTTSNIKRQLQRKKRAKKKARERERENGDCEERKNCVARQTFGSSVGKALPKPGTLTINRNKHILQKSLNSSPSPFLACVVVVLATPPPPPLAVAALAEPELTYLPGTTP